VVEAAEQCSDDLPWGMEELAAAREAAEAGLSQLPLLVGDPASRRETEAILSDSQLADWMTGPEFRQVQEFLLDLPATESAAETHTVRCIFGNPFRHVAVDPSWLTSTVVTLAAGINAERAFDRLPILADALQDAGCDNPEVLAHCRGPGPHVRGCWVVDL